MSRTWALTDEEYLPIAAFAALPNSTTTQYLAKQGGVFVNKESSGGGAIKGQSQIDFGLNNQEDSYAKSTITDTNVKSTSAVIISIAGTSTIDHDPDDYQWDNISAYSTNIVDGIGFDIIGVAPNGSFGKYNINYIINN